MDVGFADIWHEDPLSHHRRRNHRLDRRLDCIPEYPIHHARVTKHDSSLGGQDKADIDSAVTVYYQFPPRARNSMVVVEGQSREPGTGMEFRPG